MLKQRNSYSLGPTNGEKRSGGWSLSEVGPFVIERYGDNDPQPPIGDLRWHQLVAWQGDTKADPVPVVLEVGLHSPEVGEQISDIPNGIAPSVSPPPFQAARYQSCLLVEYSVGGAMRRRWIDPREGAYQLPPCSYVSVSMRAYQPNFVEVGVKYGMNISLAPGETCEPREPTYSGRFEYLGSPIEIHMRFVPGAYGARVSIIRPTQNLDTEVRVEGVQPNVIVGPGFSLVPGVADLVRTDDEITLTIAGADSAELTCEQMLTW